MWWLFLAAGTGAWKGDEGKYFNRDGPTLYSLAKKWSFPLKILRNIS